MTDLGLLTDREIWRFIKENDRVRAIMRQEIQAATSKYPYACKNCRKAIDDYEIHCIDLERKIKSRRPEDVRGRKQLEKWASHKDPETGTDGHKGEASTG